MTSLPPPAPRPVPPPAAVAPYRVRITRAYLVEAIEREEEIELESLTPMRISRVSTGAPSPAARIFPG